ncbi:hypothetical protein MSAN_00527200 [Mycena sanguinolenta]|uniref:Uncharacterized protein n=1 Tax=Mycena sanguinolenta TaxID=230812 RepID=A0A8H6ZA76_9AGAR|nr:hypothetical protein MSAN_00527200 [Mycena sanguinolenta]
MLSFSVHFSSFRYSHSRTQIYVKNINPNQSIRSLAPSREPANQLFKLTKLEESEISIQSIYFLTRKQYIYSNRSSAAMRPRKSGNAMPARAVRLCTAIRTPDATQLGRTQLQPQRDAPCAQGEPTRTDTQLPPRAALRTPRHAPHSRFARREGQ